MLGLPIPHRRGADRSGSIRGVGSAAVRFTDREEGEQVSIRVLVVARHPFGMADLDLSSFDDITVVRLVRRLHSLDELLDSSRVEVVLIDTEFPENEGIDAIAEISQLNPDVRILALTPDPPPADDVALAIRAGASGIVTVNDEPDEYATAVRTVHAGELWIPPEQSRTILSTVADDLDVTAAERRSRLATIVVGIIPIAGAVAAMLSLLWRKYLGHIGVRPVDLAIDPTSRVVDSVAMISLLFGLLGPLLFVSQWLRVIEPYARRVGLGGLLEKRRRLALAIGYVVVLGATAVLVLFADIVLIVFIGPLVAISILATALDLTTELPPAMRLTNFRPRRVAAGAGVATILFLSVLNTEVLVFGPDLRTDGAHGILAPRFLGFSAQPALVTDVEGSRPPREVLYLGGNADLYVLVDPCNDDSVEFVSVGSSRIDIIDEVTCS